MLSIGVSCGEFLEKKVHLLDMSSHTNSIKLLSIQQNLGVLHAGSSTNYLTIGGNQPAYPFL